ncbi:hypothetical protein SGI36_21665, partial [Providencia rettgeri]
MLTISVHFCQTCCPDSQLERGKGNAQPRGAWFPFPAGSFSVKLIHHAVAVKPTVSVYPAQGSICSLGNLT